MSNQICCERRDLNFIFMHNTIIRFIQEIPVVITSSYLLIEVSLSTTALIGHTYIQYQRSNAMFCNDSVTAVNQPDLRTLREV